MSHWDQDARVVEVRALAQATRLSRSVSSDAVRLLNSLSLWLLTGLGSLVGRKLVS